MKLKSLLIAATLTAATIGVTRTFADTPKPATTELIPRATLFGNPDRAGVQVSPDGKHISFLAAVDGVLNVWVAPANDLSKAKAVTSDKKRGIRQYFWAHTNDDILYLQDEGGNENWNVYRLNLSSGDVKNLTPNKSVAAQVDVVTYKNPEEIVVSLNDRNPIFHDVYRINIKTGDRKLIMQNPGMINGNMCAGLEVDDDFQVRFATTLLGDGGAETFTPTPEGKWESYMKVSAEDMQGMNSAGFDKTGTKMYLQDCRDRDTSALYLMDIKTKEKTLIAANDSADVSGVMMDPVEKKVLAVAFNRLKTEWKLIDKSMEADHKFLKTVSPGEINIPSRTLDGKTWIVSFMQDDGPVKFYKYDRDAKKAEFLFTNRKALDGVKLAKMNAVEVKSRDGLDLVTYYTLPPASDPDGDGKPNQPLPTVLLVHGGPWARDSWGYNGLHQWLANRGYAAVSVNYRGSTGLGKKFLNAANKEWAGKMHDDLIDVVDWTIAQKIAQADKIGIMGGSYGGYATLVGLTFTPDKFACGVDIVGPSRIVTLLNTIPPYWIPAMAIWKNRVGDHTTSEGREFLDSRSPLTFVEKIKKPLLIGQGANDPRVKQSESDQIVKAMAEKNIPVTYVLFPDEGHGFARPENNLSFFAVTEAFLGEHLGGAVQPIGDDFAKSSIKVKHGKQFVPGLADAKLPE